MLPIGVPTTPRGCQTVMTQDIWHLERIKVCTYHCLVGNQAIISPQNISHYVKVRLQTSTDACFDVIHSPSLEILEASVFFREQPLLHSEPTGPGDSAFILALSSDCQTQNSLVGCLQLVIGPGNYADNCCSPATSAPPPCRGCDQLGNPQDSRVRPVYR
jgi:hypothetical protein